MREEGEDRVGRWDGREEKMYFRTVINVQTAVDSNHNNMVSDVTENSQECVCMCVCVCVCVLQYSVYEGVCLFVLNNSLCVWNLLIISWLNAPANCFGIASQLQQTWHKNTLLECVCGGAFI